jgi:hypothetical protein
MLTPTVSINGAAGVPVTLDRLSVVELKLEIIGSGSAPLSMSTTGCTLEPVPTRASNFVAPATLGVGASSPLLGITTNVWLVAPVVTGNMFAWITTAAPLKPIVGKSAQFVSSESESMRKPVQPPVGSLELETAKRKLLAARGASAESAYQRRAKGSQSTRGSNENEPVCGAPAAAQKASSVLVCTRAPSLLR